MKASDYRPISCSFHDRLEDWAVRGSLVEIVWNDGGEEKAATARIVDVFARDSADHLRLDSGAEIRLDRLISVDGMRLPDGC